MDDDTVEINLSAPDPALEYYLSQAAGLMGSPKALGTDGIKTEPVGTGPYVMDKAATVKDSQSVFTARKDYWNKDLQKFDKVTFKILVDLTATDQCPRLGTGRCHPAGSQDRQAGRGRQDDPGCQRGRLAGPALLDRDGAKNPALKDVRVRQAINYAFDRKTILDQVMLGQGTPTSQPFGKASGAWVEELENNYPYDPAKAKALLKEAGYETGLVLQVPSVPGFETQLAVIKQQLADVGITLEVGSAITNTYTTDVAAQKFTTMYFSLFQGEPWVAINQIISTKALYNPFKSTTPRAAGQDRCRRRAAARTPASWPRKSTSTWWSRPGSLRCSG